MTNGPCLNPNCKSYGKPHPNCKCYGMSEGGEVSHFCSEKRDHKKGCKYFADGGSTDTAPDFIPDDQAPNDSTSTEASAPDFIPDEQPQAQVKSNPSAPDFVPDDKFIADEDKYSTPAQQIGAGVEGVAQGFAGPLATLAEQGLSKAGVPGLSDEDIKGRQDANPWTYGAGQAVGIGTGLATGVGEAGLISKGAEALLPGTIPALGKIGAAALKGFVTNAGIGGGNEISKAMLGQGDPTHPVASALANVGITGLLGSLFEGGSSALASTEAKLGSKAASFLAGTGAKVSDTPIDQVMTVANLQGKGLWDKTAFDAGYNNYDKLVDHAISGATKAGVDFAAYHVGGVPAAIVAHNYLSPILKGYITKPVTNALNLSVPVATKWLSEGAPSNLLPLLNYATQIEKGNNLISSGVRSLFQTGTQKLSPEISKTTKEAVDDWVGNGGVDADVQESINEQNANDAVQRGYAEGGEVKADKPESSKGIMAANPIGQIYPAQNMMLQTAKGRISNYLKSLRPQGNMPKLAFDDAPDQREQRKSYDKALNIAIKPLSILNEIKNGTVEPIHVKHFNSMYPELGTHLQKKITDQISEAQLKGQKPSYAVRQGLSMFLGTPLSSEMQPQNIQAAQAVFQQQQSQPQPSAPAKGKSKKGASSLSKSDQSFLTSNQALVSRSQKV